MSDSPNSADWIIASRFAISREIGRGGMGAVYECIDHRTQKRLAIKLLHEEILQKEHGARDFRRECKALSHLQHPHILEVIDFGVDGDTPYLVTELCLDKLGQPFTLGELVKMSPNNWLSVDDLNHIFPQIFDAMKFIHRKGYIHRDLKPDNVFLDATADGWVAKIADFGLIAITGDDEILQRVNASISMTMQTSQAEGLALVGTYDYMSPEQKSGDVLDARSDVYSLGLMTFRLSTGQDRIKFQLPTEIRDELPSWIDRVVKEAVEEDIAARPANAGVLLEYVHADLDVNRVTTDDVSQSNTNAISDGDNQGHDDDRDSFRPHQLDLSQATRAALPTSTPSAKPRRGATIGMVVAIVILAAIAAGLWHRNNVRDRKLAESKATLIQQMRDYDDGLTAERRQLLEQHGGDDWQTLRTSRAQIAELVAQQKYDLASDQLATLTTRTTTAIATATSVAATQAFSDALKAANAHATAGDFAAAQAAYDAAAQLPAADNDRIQTHLRELEHAQITALIVAATDAAHNQQWPSVEQLANDVLAIAPDNSDAHELLRRFAASQAPRVRVVARIDGVEKDGAIITLDGTTYPHHTPAVLPLQPGKTHTIVVSVPDAAFRPTTQSVIADFTGERLVSLVLERQPEAPSSPVETAPAPTMLDGPFAPLVNDTLAAMLTENSLFDAAPNDQRFAQLPKLGIDRPGHCMTNNGWTGSGDFDLRLSASWTNDALVFRIDVRDDRNIPIKESGDRLELFLNHYTSGPAKGVKQPWHITLAPNVKKHHCDVRVTNDDPKSADLAPRFGDVSTRLLVASRGGGRRYILLVSIPISGWRDAPAAGRTMRLQGRFSDVDSPGEAPHIFVLFPPPRDNTKSPDTDSVIGRLRFAGDVWVDCFPVHAVAANSDVVMRLDTVNLSSMPQPVSVELHGPGESVSTLVTRTLPPGTTVQKERLPIDVNPLRPGEYKLVTKCPNLVVQYPFSLNYDGALFTVQDLTELPKQRAATTHYPGNRDAEQVDATFRHLAGGGDVIWSAGHYDASSDEFSQAVAPLGPVNVDLTQTRPGPIPWALYGGIDPLDGTHEPIILRLPPQNTVRKAQRYPSTPDTSSSTRNRQVAGRGRRLLLVGVTTDYVDADTHGELRVRINRDGKAVSVHETFRPSAVGGRGHRHAYVQRVWLEDNDTEVWIDNPSQFGSRVEIDFIAVLASGSSIDYRPETPYLRFAGSETAELFTWQLITSLYMMKNFHIDINGQVHSSLPGGRYRTRSRLDTALLASELAAWGTPRPDLLETAHTAFGMNEYNYDRAATLVATYSVWRKLTAEAQPHFLAKLWRSAIAGPLGKLYDDSRVSPMNAMSTDGEFGGGEQLAATVPMYFSSVSALRAAAAMAVASGRDEAAAWSTAVNRLTETFTEHFVAGDNDITVNAPGPFPASYGLKPQQSVTTRIPAGAWLYGRDRDSAPLLYNDDLRVFDTPYLLSGLGQYGDIVGVQFDTDLHKQAAHSLGFSLAHSPVFRGKSWQRHSLLNYKTSELQLWLITAALLLDKTTMATEWLEPYIRASYDEHVGLPAQRHADIEVSPYTFEEQVYGSRTRSAGASGDDLNVRNGVAALRVARLIAGIDDHDMNELRLVTRLPNGWTSVTAKNWLISHDSGSNRVATLNYHYSATDIGTPTLRYQLKLTADRRLDQVTIRVGPFPVTAKKVLIDDGRSTATGVPVTIENGAGWGYTTFRRVDQLDLQAQAR